jgi:uncharacterized membrane protein YeaQ/YmgE (transglycosylase-associated protein family)
MEASTADPKGEDGGRGPNRQLLREGAIAVQSDCSCPLPQTIVIPTPMQLWTAPRQLLTFARWRIVIACHASKETRYGGRHCGRLDRSIIIGGIAGWLAEQFMKSNMGLLMNIVLGIAGAAVASAILSAFGIVLGGWIGYLIAGFIGACLLIWIVRAIQGRRTA